MGCALYNGKLRRRAFQQAKEHIIRHLVRKIWPWEVPRLKVGNSRECPGGTPDPRGGGPVEGCRSICMEGGVSHFDSTVVNSLPGVSRRTANPNCES